MNWIWQLECHLVSKTIQNLEDITKCGLINSKLDTIKGSKLMIIILKKVNNCNTQLVCMTLAYGKILNRWPINIFYGKIVILSLNFWGFYLSIALANSLFRLKQLNVLYINCRTPNLGPKIYDRVPHLKHLANM